MRNAEFGITTKHYVCRNPVGDGSRLPTRSNRKTIATGNLRPSRGSLMCFLPIRRVAPVWATDHTNKRIAPPTPNKFYEHLNRSRKRAALPIRRVAPVWATEHTNKRIAPPTPSKFYEHLNRSRKRAARPIRRGAPVWAPEHTNKYQ